MSYTVTIQGRQSLKGELVLSTLYSTSQSFYLPNSPRNPEGYISVNGKTSIGVVFIDEGPNTAHIETRLTQHNKHISPPQQCSFSVRSVDLGPTKMCVVNILNPQPDFSFLPPIFEGIKSPFWALENTGWWPEYGNDPQLAPPGITYPEGKSPLIILRLGQVAPYLDEFHESAQELYGNDKRGYEFTAKHPELKLSQMGDQLFTETIQNASNYETAFQQLTTKEGTGLQHGYTIMYFNESKHTTLCAHLKHKNTSEQWQKILNRDMEGNQLVIASHIPDNNFYSIGLIQQQSGNQ